MNKPRETKNLLVALDIGTSKIVAIVAEVTPDGALEALLCVQSAAVEGGVITVGAPGGAQVTVLDLPYALDGPDTRQR